MNQADDLVNLVQTLNLVDTVRAVAPVEWDIGTELWDTMDVTAPKFFGYLMAVATVYRSGVGGVIAQRLFHHLLANLLPWVVEQVDQERAAA